MNCKILICQKLICINHSHYELATGAVLECHCSKQLYINVLIEPALVSLWVYWQALRLITAV